MEKIIDGKAIAAEIKQELKQRTEGFVELFGFRPGLAVILVGTDPASRVYVNNKKKKQNKIDKKCKKKLIVKLKK